jgi:hypothetical protein
VSARRNADGLAYARLSAMGRGLCRRVTFLLLMLSVDVSLRLFGPLTFVRTVSEVEQPAKQLDTVAPLETEASRERGKRVRESAWIVVDRTDSVGDEVTDRLGILVASQQVGSNACGPGHEHAAKTDPLSVIEVTVVQLDVGTPGLMPRWKGEFVLIGRKITEPVQLRRRTVRDDSLCRHSLPCEGSRGELEPRGPQVKVLGQRRAGEMIDTAGDAFQHSPVGDEPVQRRRSCASPLSLAPRDETPLILRDLGDRAEGCKARHYCNIPRI